MWPWPNLLEKFHTAASVALFLVGSLTCGVCVPIIVKWTRRFRK